MERVWFIGGERLLSACMHAFHTLSGVFFVRCVSPKIQTFRFFFLVWCSLAINVYCSIRTSSAHSPLRRTPSGVVYRLD